MATKKKLLQAAAGAAGAAGGLNVEEVFSTYLYEGNNGTAQSITNGIDLSTEGGFVWIKQRTQNNYHYLFDTEATGNTSALLLPLTSGTSATTTALTSFNSDGFSLGSNVGVNGTHDMASWTFRKAPKFFDVVYSWTGDGTSSQTISHNLGSVPGAIFVKCTSTTDDWRVYHRSMGNTDMMALNSTGAAFSSVNHWNNTSPTDTEFTVGANANVSGRTYVAYLFAHNDGDGDFGSTADQDIIKCGSYTGNGSADGPEVDLGFEPQWVMIKASSRTGDWEMHDNMRGMTETSDSLIRANLSSAESSLSIPIVSLTPTGFKIRTNDLYYNGSSETYIYIAIRRGPMAVPEDATDVFNIDTRTGSLPSYVSTFPVDMALRRLQSISGSWTIGSRLTGTKQLETSSTNAEGTDTDWAWDYMEGYGDDPNVAYALYSWMWKRAPNYFDVVTYTGNGSTQTISHNLGVAPEMIWVKNRTTAYNWSVYHADLGSSKYLELDGTAAAAAASTSYWQQIDPTESAFYVGNRSALNKSGDNLIAYLFASLDGVSKVGSFTINNADITVDCGFSNGARFVLIKRYSGTDDWWVFDTERGYVSGSGDAALKLNTTAAESPYTNMIDPHSSGFSLRSAAWYNGDYIFYAIA